MTTQPAPTETVKLKIDGHDVSVPKGTNVLEAAREIGIDISYFCYHPGLSSPAVCRQCLVDVKGSPKPVPACYTPVAENMEVQTATPHVLAVRAQMLEFTLLNHPVDCPICDKAGECDLQRLYHRWDAEHARTDVGKVHKSKMVDIGPRIVLDQERCILCTRCIRVCDEVAGQSQLTMANRGDREVLTTAPGQSLDNPYSLNTVDVCPVGALTSKDFRFTMRAWELYTTDSVCPGCSTGCNVEVHHAQGEVWRLVPRHNDAVNRYWMCDEGRLTYKEIAAEDRVAGSFVGGDPVPLDKAVAYAAERIAAAREAGTLGVVFGAQATDEDLYLLGKVAVGVLGAKQVYIGGRPPQPAREDKILRSPDVNPNFAGARNFATLSASPAGPAQLEQALASGRITALWVLGEDMPLTPGGLAKLGEIETIVMATRWNPIAQAAKVVLPSAAWAEIDGTFTNRQGLVQRVRRAVEPRGGARPAWELILAIARKLDVALDVGPAPVTARSIFNRMKAEVPAYAAAEWGRPAPLVQLRFAHSRG
jgi:NADH-quinone oxidoreductase subunit G